MKKSTDAEDLLHKYNLGQCTEAEKAIVETWFLNWKGDDSPVSKEETTQAVADIYKRLPQPIEQVHIKLSPNWPLRIAFAAASIAIIATVWTLLTVKTATPYKNDINPGSNQATLTLPNGQTINLSTSKTGVSISNQLTYNDSTAVISASSPPNLDNPLASPSSMNSKTEPLTSLAKPTPEGLNEANPLSGDVKMTMSTPRGGTYQITLPDGTKVWLNAASKLEFPSNFRNKVQRIVKLEGEAYFEVAKLTRPAPLRGRTRAGQRNLSERIPFLVQSKNQTVEVLGTHFNISAYADEPNTKTTLLEGAVRVAQLASSTITLRPNQQAITTGKNIITQQVDPSDAVAWKNGEFAFRNEPLENIMLKIARWYNVEITYKNKAAAAQLFGGSVSRYQKVSEVLCMLELTEKVHFKIEGRRITVE